MENKILESDVARKTPVYGALISDDLRSMVVTQVLARAGKSCQDCGADETRERGAYLLHIHYVDGDPTNTRFNNLRLLCTKCDKEAHYGLSLKVDMPEKSTPLKGTPPGSTPSKRAPRQAQKIENVTDRLIRYRIEKITPKSAQMCCKYTYLIDGRISEAVSEAYASDTRTTPRGPVGTDVKMDLWFPPEFHSREEAFKAQKDDGIKRVHPISIYTVATAKRRGRPRTVALPLDPTMEPWAMEMMQYFEEKGDDHVFPMTRQAVWKRARHVWADLVYIIEDYSVVIDNEAKGILEIDTQTTEQKRKSKRIDRHKRRWTLHALRHLRASDLVDYYMLTGAELSSFGGWTISTAMNVGSSVGRYLSLDWRSYVRKMLRKRY